jgi:hypothetical protein
MPISAKYFGGGLGLTISDLNIYLDTEDLGLKGNTYV